MHVWVERLESRHRRYALGPGAIPPFPHRQGTQSMRRCLSMRSRTNELTNLNQLYRMIMFCRTWARESKAVASGLQGGPSSLRQSFLAHFQNYGHYHVTRHNRRRI